MQRVEEEEARWLVSTESLKKRMEELIGRTGEGTSLLGDGQNGFMDECRS